MVPPYRVVMGDRAAGGQNRFRRGGLDVVPLLQLAAGPSWTDFARVMGVSDPVAKSAAAVFVLNVARALPGHRDQLEKAFREPPAKGDSVAGEALMQHLQGGNWQYLTIQRYNSWQEYGASEANTQAQMLKNAGPWYQIREHMIFHRDTIAHRVAP